MNRCCSTEFRCYNLWAGTSFSEIPDDWSLFTTGLSFSAIPDDWSLLTTGQGSIDDPHVISFHEEPHLVYWNEFDRQIHLFRSEDLVWHAENFADGSDSSMVNASGSATCYILEDRLHAVSRAGIRAKSDRYFQLV